MSSIQRTYRFTNKTFTGDQAESEIDNIVQSWNNHDQGLSSWTTLKVTGSTVIGTGLATSATTGFLYIPSCAGTPTGVPVIQTNATPIVWDRTNKKLYIYQGGWIGGINPGVFS